MTALSKADASGVALRSFDDVVAVARSLAQARGFVPQHYAGNAPAIAAAILTGIELGIGPMQAIREVHVIEGRPTLSAAMMLALAIRAGVRPQWVRADDDEAVLRLVRPGWEPHEERFSMADARRAGLGEKGNWKKHPRAMLRARAISAALRAYCPDVLGGSVYVEGELEPEPETTCVLEPAAVVATGDEPAPRRLRDCTSAAQLDGWLAANAARCTTDDARQRVLAHAESLGVDSASVMRWLEET